MQLWQTIFTQHLEDDVDNLRIVSWTELAFGVAGTAG